MDDKIKGTEARKLRERLLRREEILRAATRVFATKGYSQATLDEIADEAEFGKVTLYNYFQNKEELFYAVVVEGLDSLTVITREIGMNPKYGLFEAFQLQATSLLRAMFERIDVLSIIMREFHTPEHIERIFSHFQSIIEALEAPLHRVLSAGGTFPIEPRRFTMTFMSTLLAQFRCTVLGCTPSQSHGTLRMRPLSTEEIDREVAIGVHIMEFTVLAGLKSLDSALPTHS